jgi:hypothetical protein
MGILSKLFGVKQKAWTPRVVEEMGRLSEASRMALAMSLMEDLGAGKVAGDERLRLVDKAGCQASLLFDTGLAQEHAHLDADAEWREVMAWIARKPLLRHLVVQTLRVLPIVHLAATAQPLDPLPGIRVLERFGKDVPVGAKPGLIRAAAQGSVGRNARRASGPDAQLDAANRVGSSREAAL